MTWQLDPAHSSVTVSTKHMMITTVRGNLAIRHAEIEFDPEHPDQGSVVAVIDAASIDTGAAQRDEHLRSPDFLDTASYPEISFHSTRIEPQGQRYLLHGDLTLHGVTRPVTLEAEVEGIVADMRGGTRASFTATTRVNREDYGLNWNVALETGGWLVGKELKVEIELVAVEAAGTLAGAASAKAA
jgi:polyisoprenoid-binding protein YceI